MGIVTENDDLMIVILIGVGIIVALFCCVCLIALMRRRRKQQNLFNDTINKRVIGENKQANATHAVVSMSSVSTLPNLDAQSPASSFGADLSDLAIVNAVMMTGVVQEMETKGNDSIDLDEEDDGQPMHKMEGDMIDGDFIVDGDSDEDNADNFQCITPQYQTNH